MLRLLTFLAFLLLAQPLQAALALDPALHPGIALVSTQKARYAPGEAGAILVSLRPAAAPFQGMLVTTIFRNLRQVAQDRRPVAIGASPLALHVPFQAPASDLRGYRVDVSLLGADGRPVDRAFGSIDVEAGTLPTRFPRQCWISRWDEGLDAEALLDSQVAWRCNIVQAYANYYRPELAPPPDLERWPSLPNRTVSRATIRNVIAAAHARSLAMLFFQGTGEAYDDFLRRGTGPTLDQGSFVRPCSTARPCTEADLDRSPPAPDNWSQYRWQADHLDLFDLCSPGWQAHLLARSIKPMIDQFGFDGWQADTLGPPAGTRFDVTGKPKDPGACLSAFTSSAQTTLGKPVVVNTVSGWHLGDVVQSGTQPMLYRETWNFDSPSFAALDTLADGLRRDSARAIIQPAYLQRAVATKCAQGKQTGPACAVNIASPLLLTATLAIGGSTFMNHMDDGCIATGVFIEGYHLPCPAAVTDALLRYKNFEVAYQPLLRDGVTPSPLACTILSGAPAGSTGTPGQISVRARTRAGHQICHLLNLVGISTDRWTDMDGTMPAPIPAADLEMKLYYPGSPVRPGIDRLWSTTPDADNGAAVDVAYSVGSDEAGQFVRFTLPRLAYWSMIVLETRGRADDDLHIDAYEPLLGAHFSTAANGIAATDGAASATCCGRWARYAGLQFGTVTPRTVRLGYDASAAASVTLRLDSPSGPILARCPLAPPGGSVDCPVARAKGLHDLILVFDGADVRLRDLRFVH